MTKQKKLIDDDNSDIYRDIFNNVDELLFLHDLDGKFILTNRCLNETWGYSKTEMINKNARDFVSEEYRAEFDKYLARIKASGFDSGIGRIVTGDGQTLFVEYKNSLVSTPEGPKYIRGICRNITEQLKIKKALEASEKKLIESERKYRDIFENINEFIFTHDLDGNFIDTNFHFQKKEKYAKGELINQNIRDMMPEKYRYEFDKYLKRIKANGSDKGILSVVGKDGSKVVLEYTNSLIQGIDGPIGVRGVARDITAEYKAQKSLKKSEDELRVARDESEKLIQERTKELSDANEKLKEKTKDIEESNIALRILLNKKGEAQKELEERMMINIKDLILPLLTKMKLGQLAPSQKMYLDVIESNLNNVIAPFAVDINSKYHQLTPTEIQIANLVREGKTTKEIANLKNLALSTIHTHRDNIRDKLQIKNKKTNLRTHLMALQK